MPSSSFQVASTGQTLHAGRVVALLALHRHVELVRVRHRVVVVAVAACQVDRRPSPSPARGCSELLGRAGRGCSPGGRPRRTCGSRCRSTEVQRVAELHALLRAVVGDGDLGAVLVAGLLLQAVHDGGELVRPQLLVVVLQELVEGGLLRRPLNDGGHRLGERRGAQRRAGYFEHGPAFHLAQYRQRDAFGVAHRYSWWAPCEGGCGEW